MLDDLKEWEAHPPTGAPQLVVVSTADTQENQALGFRAPVLLDSNMSVGSKFGTNGTPMAVLEGVMMNSNPFDERFDKFTKALANPTPRRSVTCSLDLQAQLDARATLS